MATGSPIRVILVNLLLSSAGLWASAVLAGSPGEKQTAVVARPAAGTDQTGTIILHGKVLREGNRPVAHAHLYLTVNEWTKPEDLGASDAAGNYRFVVSASKLLRKVTGSWLDKSLASLTAVASGFGPDWSELPDIEGGRYGQFKAEYAHDFHLAADLPVNGRVLDGQGKPVAGATVEVSAMHDLSDPHWWKMPPAIKSIDTKIMSRQEVDPGDWFSPLYRTAWQVIPPATTDTEGRFRLNGVGGNRAVRLEVRGPGIRSTSVSVLTRQDAAAFAEAIRAKYPRTLREPDGYFYPQREASHGDPGVLLFGPSPTVEVDPARTLSGLVRDAATGKPIPDLEVMVVDAFGAGAARTDRHGRYRLLRAEDDAAITVLAGNHHDHYQAAVRKLGNAHGLGEIVADFNLPRGVKVSGRVLETGTDRPIVSGPRQGCHDVGLGPLVAGYVTYFPLASNIALRGTPAGLYFEGIPAGIQNYYRAAVIDGEGRFQISVPPGPGLLLIQSSPGMPMFGEAMTWNESLGYHRLFPYLKLTSRDKNDGAGGEDAKTFPGFVAPISIANYHAYRVINPAADATKLDLTVHIPRAASRMVRFVDPAGHAIRGVSVKGLVAAPQNCFWGMTIELDGSEAEVMALEPGKPRQIVAMSRDGKYAVATFLKGDDPGPATIRLEPAASITGRIVDEKGRPVQALLSPAPPPRDAEMAADPGTVLGFQQTRTDADGRFRLSPMLAGRYSGEIRGAPSDSAVVGMAFENLVLRSGETRDVGEIRVKSNR